jgi:TolB-like protein/tetratricopeptide (TPR) repeat protein
MADGMAEELLNLLAKVPDLKVIARTSSFAFKGEKIDIAEIARKLNVAHILDGSVRTSGDKVRFTAQLVRASDRSHLWSETQERPLDAIFAVQDEGASQVIDAHAVTLLNPKDPPRTNTRDSQAYNLYRRGRFFAQKRTREDSERALHYLREALALSPSDALVRVELANVYLMQAEDGWAPFEEGYELAEKQVEAALKLDPRLGTAHAGLGWIQPIHLEWSAAEENMRKATMYAPGNAEVLLRAGWIAAELGQWDRALSLIDRSLERDPLSIYGHEYRAYLLTGLGRPAEAESSYRIVFELSPDRDSSRASIALTLLQQGKPRDALRELREESGDPWTLFALCVIHHSLGHAVDSNSYLQSLEDLDAADVPIRVAEAHAWRGENDLAFEWLDIAFEQGSSYVYDIKMNSYFRRIADDPRYKAFLRKMKLPT